MNHSEQRPFYIGYEKKAPLPVAKTVKRFSILLVALALLTAVVIIFGQGKFPLSVFEFQQYREFEGIVHTSPYPVLMAESEKKGAGESVAHEYLLVSEGKHGANEEVAAFDGKRVRLRGSLIYRDGITMIEVVSHSVQSTENSHNQATQATSSPQANSLGNFTLRGEIVDSKCYLGVMNPGNTKPHRECAARCISGGIPPMLLVRDAAGATSSLLLVSRTGAPVNKEVLDYVAEPVEISGEIIREGQHLLLRAEPSTYRRLP